MNSDKPLISVIVPCYNQGIYLAETLNSVVSQTYVNWECLIINDGSTDNTSIIAKAFCSKDQRFKYIEQGNKGLSNARNAGLELAFGDYIQLLDSDDILLPDKLERQLELMLIQNLTDICVSRYMLFSTKKEEVYNNRFSLANFNCSTYGFLYEWGEKFTFPPICYFIKRDFLNQRKIRFNEHLKALEDWYFLVESSLKGANFLICERSLALYREHGNSMSKDFTRMSHSLIITSFNILDLLPESQKFEFKENISHIIIKRLANSLGKQEEKIKANSIDYKLGSCLLFPLHLLSKGFKNLMRYLRKL